MRGTFDDPHAAKQASRADIAAGARAHYDDVSTKALDWMSTIPRCIDAWEREPTLVEERDSWRRVAERLETEKVAAEAALARKDADIAQLRSEWSVMARACGNYRDFGMTPTPEMLERRKLIADGEFQCAARAIIEREELRAALALAERKAEGAQLKAEQFGAVADDEYRKRRDVEDVLAIAVGLKDASEAKNTELRAALALQAQEVEKFKAAVRHWQQKKFKYDAPGVTRDDVREMNAAESLLLSLSLPSAAAPVKENT